jgi:hypothetical protein
MSGWCLRLRRQDVSVDPFLHPADARQEVVLEGVGGPVVLVAEWVVQAEYGTEFTPP